MKRSLARSRKPLQLPVSLNRHLNQYAAAACAAGVGFLALARPSEAKIVYTKTHKVIGTNGIYPLDLNHDGTIDFVIQERGNPSSSNNGLRVKEAFGNAVEGKNAKVGERLASVVRKGASIGPRQRFVKSTFSYGEIMVEASCSESGCSTIGQWTNVRNGYLGLKFQIDGKTHYGWARLNVQLLRNFEITATLIGYAYETVPQKAIRAGQTRGATNDAATPHSTDSVAHDSPAITRPGPYALQPASLARLARGTQAVATWSRP